MKSFAKIAIGREKINKIRAIGVKNSCLFGGTFYNSPYIKYKIRELE
jgi:hypothetical protein